MAKNWFVAQAVRNREIDASISVVAYGFESYIPIIQRTVTQRGRLVELSLPRFGTYIFVRFDRDQDDWPRLMHERTHKKYFTRVLCNSNGKPAPIPDAAMKAIREFIPPTVQTPAPVIYQPGQRVVYTIAGVRREGVFVEYCGRRPFIRTWILGAEHVTEVSSAQLEPFELDSESDLSTKCSA